jgi:ribosomal protein L37AE/L43A
VNDKMSCGLCRGLITIDRDTRVWRCQNCHAFCYVEPLLPHTDPTASVADLGMAVLAEALRRLAERRTRDVLAA